MTIEKAKLKALAEAATPGPWSAGEEHESANFQGYVVGNPEGWIATLGTANEDSANADYIAAANPATVLALLAEIEQLTAGFNEPVRMFLDAAEQACAAQRERDQLKAENKALRNTGFARPFYQIAEAVGVKAARPESPMAVFEAEILPAVREAAKDADRLNRLDNEREAYGTSFHEGNRWVLDGQFATVRDAIDATLGAEQQL